MKRLVQMALLALVVVIGAPEARAETVRVQAVGDTRDAARLDAIRQAMTQTTRQLVVADRAVIDDAIASDRVLSTMNGVIEAFEVLSERRTPLGIAIIADVSVSESGVTNYVAELKGATAAVDGSSMFAEVQRDLADGAAKRDLFARLFEGFPSGAMDVAVTGVTLSEGRDQVRVDIRYGLTPAFVEALDSGVEPLSAMECSIDASRWNTIFPRGGGEAVSAPVARWTSGLIQHWQRLSCADTQGRAVQPQPLDQSAAVCFIDDDVIRCRVREAPRECAVCDRLPSLRYAAAGAGVSPVRFAVFPRDAAGALTAARCLVVDGLYGPDIGHGAQLSAGMPAVFDPNNAILMVRPQAYDVSLALPVGAFDVARTQSVDVVPVYLAKPPNRRFANGANVAVFDVGERAVPESHLCARAQAILDTQS